MPTGTKGLDGRRTARLPESLALPGGTGVNGDGGRELGAAGARPTAGDRPPVRAPGEAKPGGENAGAGDPGVDAPGVGAPGVDPPGVHAPGVGAPGVGAPGVGAPGNGTPVGRGGSTGNDPEPGRVSTVGERAVPGVPGAAASDPLDDDAALVPGPVVGGCSGAAGAGAAWGVNPGGGAAPAGARWPKEWSVGARSDDGAPPNAGGGVSTGAGAG